MTGAPSIGLTAKCVTVVAKSRYARVLQLLLDILLKLHGRPLDSVSSMWLPHTHKVRLDPLKSGKVHSRCTWIRGAGCLGWRSLGQKK